MNSKKEQEMLAHITSHFGIETELTKLSEEVGELLNECYKKHFVHPEAGNVEDEVADVMVVIAQILLYFDVDMDKVEEIYNQKIERTIQRIDSDWYDKHR